MDGKLLLLKVYVSRCYECTYVQDVDDARDMAEVIGQRVETQKVLLEIVTRCHLIQELKSTPGCINLP